MAVVSEMLIRIAADTAQLRSQMQQAEQTVGGSLNGIKNIATQARGALIGFFAIDKAMDLAGAFIKTADAMALTAARLKLVTSSQAEYLSVQKDVYRIAQQNSIGLDEMAQLYAKLHDPVKRLGGTTAETTKITESFALALRVGGASTTEAASATLQFAQAMASGRLNGDEFRSIAEASPRFMKALAEGMGVPIEQLKKMSGEGKLTADVVGNALMKSLGALQQEAQSIPDTVGGAFTRLKNDVAVFAVELNGVTNSTGTLAETIGLAADWVKQITTVFKEWGEATKGTTSQIDLVGIAMKVLGTIFETLIVIGAEVAYVVKGIAKTFADVATLAQAFAEGGLKGLSEAYKRVTAENEATLAAHQKFTAGVVGATDRVLQQREALKNNSLSAAENANEMARLTGRHGTLQTAVLKSAVANEDATKAEAKRVAEVKKLMDGLEDQTGALLANEAANGKLSKAEQTSLKIMQDLQQGRIKLTDTEKRALVASLELLINTEKRIDATKDLADAQRKAAEHSAKLTDAEWNEVEALREGNVKLMEQNAVLRVGEAAVRAREVAVLRARATDLEWAAANEGGNQALEEQVRLLRQRADLIEEGSVLQYAKETADEWKRTAENIERSLTDSLMRAFESGKDFGQTLKDTLKNMFNTLVLRPIIQPIAQGMSSAVLGMLGMSPGTASASGGMGSMMNLASMGQSAYGLLSGGTVGNAFAFGADSIGSWLVNNTTGGLNSLGGSLMGNAGAIGTMGSYLGAGALGIMGGSAIAGKYNLGGMSGSTSSTIGTVIGAAIAGPIGAAIGGLLGGLANRAFGRGPKEAGDSGIVGSLGGGSINGQMYADWRQDGGWFRSDRSGTDYSAINDDLKNAINLGASGIYQQTKQWAEVLKLPAEALAGITTQFKVKLTGNAEADQKAIADMLESYQTALVNQYTSFLEPLRLSGERLVDTMQRLVVLDNFAASIEDLGGIFLRVSNSSYEARQSLIDMAGGLDNLVGQIGQFVNDYYTDAEKAGMSAQSIAEALKAVGIEAGGLMTREDFRRLVESRDVDTEAGRQQLATLLQLGPQFAQLSDYLREMGYTVETAMQDAPTNAILNQMVDPAQATATAVTTMSNSVNESNTLLTKIEGKLSSISDTSKGAADAAAAAVQAAQAAVKAAQEALRTVSLASSAPTYTSNLGA
jgi:tape measure domain-containing protein